MRSAVGCNLSAWNPHKIHQIPRKIRQTLSSGIFSDIIAKLGENLCARDAFENNVDNDP